jgi:subtilisin family serine protease
MMFLPKGMFVTSLALAASAAAIGSVSAADVNPSPEDNLPQYVPYESSSTTTTLLVSYKDENGHDNLVGYTKKMKGEGKSTEEKKNFKLSKKHKVKKGIKNFSDGKKGKSDKIKDKDRRLNLFGDIEEEEEDVFITGFSVIEVDNEDIDAEIAALSALEGVATVEMDQEMHVMSMEYQQKLRGGKGAEEHIREIQDAIEATADQLREDKVEGGGSNHGRRRLAEDTPYGITMVKSAYVNQQTPPPGATPIKICVVDTGYGLGHPDLPDSSHGVNGFSPYGSNERWDEDGHGHGSHCAGTIGAIGGNNEGVTSVNPDPTKFIFFIGKGLTNSGSGSGSGVLAAVQSCVDNGAKVISMSLGGGGFSSSSNAQYEEHYEAGVLIIAAAGNDGNSAMSYPASYNTVVSVASVDSSEVRSSFSQYNDQVELAAPGTAVKSTITTNSGTKFSYASWSGTSMATPHVAGVAALLWYNFPDCTNNQIRNAMIMSSKDLGAPSWDL